MNKLLILLLLIPMISFGDFDEYGRSAGGFSILSFIPSGFFAVIFYFIAGLIGFALPVTLLIIGFDKLMDKIKKSRIAKKNKEIDNSSSKNDDEVKRFIKELKD